jgi:hypothetical protein
MVPSGWLQCFDNPCRITASLRHVSRTQPEWPHTQRQSTLKFITRHLIRKTPPVEYRGHTFQLKRSGSHSNMD